MKMAVHAMRMPVMTCWLLGLHGDGGFAWNLKVGMGADAKPGRGLELVHEFRRFYTPSCCCPAIVRTAGE